MGKAGATLGRVQGQRRALLALPISSLLPPIRVPSGSKPLHPHLISSLSHTRLDASWSLFFALSFPLSAPSWQAIWAPRVELGVNSWVPTESSFSPEGTGVTSVVVSRRWWEAKASESSGIGRGVASMPHITGDGGAQETSVCVSTLFEDPQQKVCVTLLPWVVHASLQQGTSSWKTDAHLKLERTWKWCAINFVHETRKHQFERQKRPGVLYYLKGCRDGWEEERTSLGHIYRTILSSSEPGEKLRVFGLVLGNLILRLLIRRLSQIIFRSQC